MGAGSACWKKENPLSQGLEKRASNIPSAAAKAMA